MTSKDVCSRCIFFKPNIYYPYIGYCVIKNESKFYEEPAVCESFKPSSIDELKKALETQGWLYCVNCRKVIHDVDELEKHVREHLVSTGIVIDEAVAEEAHSVD